MDQGVMQVKLEATEVDPCTMCLEGMEAGQDLYVLQRCGHSCHTECLLGHVNRGNWDENGPRCALCNLHIGDDAIKELEQKSHEVAIKASTAKHASKEEEKVGKAEKQVKLEAVSVELCSICHKEMYGQQALFTLPECGHEYHTPCFLTYANMETEKGKALKCKCGTPIGTKAGKELEQLNMEAMIYASKACEVPGPVQPKPKWNISAYFELEKSLTPVVVTSGQQAKAAPTSSGNVKSEKQKPVKNSSASQKLVQAT